MTGLRTRGAHDRWPCSALEVVQLTRSARSSSTTGVSQVSEGSSARKAPSRGRLGPVSQTRVRGAGEMVDRFEATGHGHDRPACSANGNSTNGCSDVFSLSQTLPVQYGSRSTTARAAASVGAVMTRTEPENGSGVGEAGSAGSSSDESVAPPTAARGRTGTSASRAQGSGRADRPALAKRERRARGRRGLRTDEPVPEARDGLLQVQGSDVKPPLEGARVGVVGREQQVLRCVAHGSGRRGRGRGWAGLCEGGEHSRRGERVGFDGGEVELRADAAARRASSPSTAAMTRLDACLASEGRQECMQMASVWRYRKRKRGEQGAASSVLGGVGRGS